MTEVFTQEILKKHISTLSETSADTSISPTVYMTDSKLAAINFDAVTDEYTQMLGIPGDVAKSVDALISLHGQITLVEFKNGDMRHERSNVTTKVRDSLLILGDILDSNISHFRKNFCFILVYNESKNKKHSPSQAAISEHIVAKGDAELIRFGLSRFRTLYLKDVHTFTEAEFEDYIETK